MPDVLTMDKISDAAQKVAEKYRLTKVSLFGSYARGEASQNSDVDLVVEMSKPLGFARGGVFNDFESMLGRDVDVVFGRDRLYPFVRESFDNESVVVYERSARKRCAI